MAFLLLKETSEVRAGGHDVGNSELVKQSCGGKASEHSNREKFERKILASPADHTRVPYSQQNHHYHHQWHTTHPRVPQHNTVLRPLEEKDSWGPHHKQSTVRDQYLTWLIILIPAFYNSYNILSAVLQLEASDTLFFN